jgi:hypothetical protein
MPFFGSGLAEDHVRSDKTKPNLRPRHPFQAQLSETSRCRGGQPVKCARKDALSMLGKSKDVLSCWLLLVAYAEPSLKILLWVCLSFPVPSLANTNPFVLFLSFLFAVEGIPSAVSSCFC